VTSLVLAHNQVVSPIENIAYMTKLATLDISYNLITAATSFADQYGQVGVLFSALPNSIVSADFSVCSFPSLSHIEIYNGGADHNSIIKSGVIGEVVG
jgi:hypothetical protein